MRIGVWRPPADRARQGPRPPGHFLDRSSQAHGGQSGSGGGLNLGIHVPWEGDTGRGIGGVTGLIFQTPDIKKAFDALKEQGVRIGEEPSERPALSVIMGTFYDPDDNEFVVWEPFK